MQQAGENDLVICLISGGASSLWIDIPDGASLNDLQSTYELLLKSGATIDEMNTIRKHLSAIKGGQILQYAPRANWFSLIISDVPGDDLSVIANGPTVPILLRLKMPDGYLQSIIYLRNCRRLLAGISIMVLKK